jgi:competence protein ComEC
MSCLADHVPFYDKQIELVIITHPQQDHMGGLIYVAKSYSIMQFVSVPAANPIRVYKWLIEEYESQNLTIANVYSGDKIKVGQMQFQVVWPTREFMAAHTAGGESKVLGVSTDGTDLNSFAIVGILSLGNFDVLLTGDADSAVGLAEMDTGLLREVEVLKVPHHGSKTGMLPEWLQVVNPQLAVISAGKNNRYGHPRAETLDLLRSFGIQTLRTDQMGDIEVVSDGKSYFVK